MNLNLPLAALWHKIETFLTIVGNTGSAAYRGSADVSRVCYVPKVNLFCGLMRDGVYRNFGIFRQISVFFGIRRLAKVSSVIPVNTGITGNAIFEYRFTGNTKMTRYCTLYNCSEKEAL